MAIFAFLSVFTTPIALAEVVKLQRLNRAPVVDGNGADWETMAATKLALHKINPDAKTDVSFIIIKGGIYEDHIYFFLEWQDTTEDLIHKPWVWNKKQLKYVTGPEREDRLAIQFLLRGDYSTDWFSGKNFTADMWHWKAYRSNTLGLVHDKSTIISHNKLLRSSKYRDRNGEYIYISRPSDAGDKLYRTKRYRKYDSDIMPKYILNNNPTGSVADLKAKGVWRNNKWYLEIQRKLRTEYKDDIQFHLGQTVVGGIAVFNHSENDDHVITDNLMFKLPN